MTYLGGSSWEASSGGVSVDAVGSVLVGGRTGSIDFFGANNTYNGGSCDSYVVKVSTSGTLQWATYLGGRGWDDPDGIAIDAVGNTLIAGYTESADFSRANNQRFIGQDAFVAKVSVDGHPLWATYVGGNNGDWARSIAVDAEGNALVAGGTYSTNFSGANNSYKREEDAFVARVSHSGTLQWATYLGGSGRDAVYGIAVDTQGNALVTGSTYSADFSGANNEYKGSGDAFVAKITGAGVPFDPGDTLATARNLGEVAGKVVQRDYAMERSSDRDWFKFQTVASATNAHYVDVLFSNAVGNLDAKLYDANGKLIRLGSSVSDNERISLQGLVAGTYYLEVYSRNHANSYGLAFMAPERVEDILADSFESNDTRTTATDLGTVTGTVEHRGLTIHRSSDRDWFKFQTLAAATNPHYIDVLFSHSVGDLDARLYDADGKLIRWELSVSDNERLSLRGLTAGTYYLEVCTHNRPNRYDLVIEAPVPAFTVDRFEPNDYLKTATDLGVISGALKHSGLTIHSSADRDRFKFQTVASGSDSHYIDILFHNSVGDIDARLYDADGHAIGERYAWTVKDNERILLEDLPPGTYYLYIFTQNRPNGYDLVFEAPEVQVEPDAFETNDTLQTASDLGAVEGRVNYERLTLHYVPDTPDFRDRDFFSFILLADGTISHFIDVRFSGESGSIDARIYDANGTLVRSIANTDDNELISLNGMKAGRYYIELYGGTNGVRCRHARPPLWFDISGSGAKIWVSN